jgi:hypothetical protein
MRGQAIDIFGDCFSIAWHVFQAWQLLLSSATSLIVGGCFSLTARMTNPIWVCLEIGPTSRDFRCLHLAADRNSALHRSPKAFQGR